ncbi:choice-of-anchor L domain-containing protein [Desulfonatronum parangueonense]
MSNDSTNVFHLYDPDQQTPQDLLSHIIANIPGINIDWQSVRLTTPPGATSFFSSIFFGMHQGQAVGMETSGLLLTSGDGSPPLQNTERDYTVAHFAPGDAELSQIALEAFPAAGPTFDASVLEFSFSVTDPWVRGISFDVIFGSEEFPDFIDSEFVDIAAITVNGRNYAYLDGDPAKPLSIIGATVGDGRFIDNIGTASFGDWEDFDWEDFDWEDLQDGPSINAPLAIEYNGLTPRMTIYIPIDINEPIHTVRIGVADTGDTEWDSGLFVSNFKSLGTDFEGVLVVVEAPAEGGVMGPPAPNTPTHFISGPGNDIITGSTGQDFYDLTAGGQNLIQGTLEQLNNDVINGFDADDALLFLGAFFNPEQLAVIMGSAILHVDSNGDGQSDTVVTLQGDYSNGQFQVSQTEQGTAVTFEPGTGIQFTSGDWLSAIYLAYWGRPADPEGLDYWLNQWMGTDAQGAQKNAVWFASTFALQPEAIAAYDYFAAYTAGDDITPQMRESFIQDIYQNLFNRAPDAEGFSYWLNLLDSGAVDPGVFIAEIVNSALSNAGGPDAQTILAKMQVAEHVTSIVRANMIDSGILLQGGIKDIIAATTPGNVAQKQAQAEDILLPAQNAVMQMTWLTEQTSDLGWEDSAGDNMLDMIQLQGICLEFSGI